MSTEDMHRYDDMLELPHHESKTHPRMPRENRAAQFSPFAALSGYGDAISETARLTEQRPELDEQKKAQLDETLAGLKEGLSRMPLCRVSYFVPDMRKSGGEIVTRTGRLKMVDTFRKTILLEGGNPIFMDDVIDIEETE